jgi:hypothetical protein
MMPILANLHFLVYSDMELQDILSAKEVVCSCAATTTWFSIPGEFGALTQLAVLNLSSNQTINSW